eukprot:2672478-Rhodomonas_salina.2
MYRGSAVAYNDSGPSVVHNSISNSKGKFVQSVSIPVLFHPSSCSTVRQIENLFYKCAWQLLSCFPDTVPGYPGTPGTEGIRLCGVAKTNQPFRSVAEVLSQKNATHLIALSFAVSKFPHFDIAVFQSERRVQASNSSFTLENSAHVEAASTRSHRSGRYPDVPVLHVQFTGNGKGKRSKLLTLA